MCHYAATHRLYVSSSIAQRDPHSCPTRRSSDLAGGALEPEGRVRVDDLRGHEPLTQPPGGLAVTIPRVHDQRLDPSELIEGVIRSEEHTSELQSRENLVCRLLLEKKKYRHSEKT